MKGWDAVKEDPKIFERLSACLTWHYLALKKRELTLKMSNKNKSCPAAHKNWWPDLHGSFHLILMFVGILKSMGEWWRKDREQLMVDEEHTNFTQYFEPSKDKTEGRFRSIFWCATMKDLPPNASNKEEIEFMVAIKHFKEDTYPVIKGKKRRAEAEKNY